MADIRITLAAARVNANMNQQQAAKALGISPATLCAWERGRTKVPPVAMIALSAVYGMPQDAFLVPDDFTKRE